MTCQHCGKESGEYQLCPECFEEFQNGNLCKCKNCDSYYHKGAICSCMKHSANIKNQKNNDFFEHEHNEPAGSGCLTFILVVIAIIALCIIIPIITVLIKTESEHQKRIIEFDFSFLCETTSIMEPKEVNYNDMQTLRQRI